MPITPEEKRILAKMHTHKKATAKELIKVVNPVFQSMCINPKYVTAESDTTSSSQTFVHTGSEKNLKRIGIPEGYGGWTSTWKKHKDKSTPKKAIHINNEMSNTAQIVTLAHETGHVVMKKALQKDVGKKEAERKGGAMERAFVSRFNKRYGKHGVELDFGESKSKFKPRKGDAEIVRKNINTNYLRKGCKL